MDAAGLSGAPTALGQVSVDSPYLMKRKNQQYPSGARTTFGTMKKPRTALGSTHDERMVEFAGKKLDELLKVDANRFRATSVGKRTSKRK